MSDNLREYYETVFEPGEHRVPFESLSHEEKSAVQNTLGFGFWNLSRSFEHFAKTAKEAMRGYRYKHVRRVR